jgi:hypothetical protein
LLLTAALVATVTHVAPASAAFLTYDLTGTWTGSITCSEYDGGVKVKPKTVLTPTMRITQVGVSLGVLLDFGTSTRLYGGLANPDAKKPEQKGEAALIRCGTSDVIATGLPNQIARMTVSAKPGKVKATFKGVSIFTDPSDPEPRHGTCKWKWKRIDTVNSAVDTQCGLTTLRPPPAVDRNGGGR